MEVTRLHPELGSSALALGEADASQGCVQTGPGTQQKRGGYPRRRRSLHHVRMWCSAPPTRRRGHETWAPPRRVRLLPGPSLQLSWARGEPGAGPLSGAKGGGAL